MAELPPPVSPNSLQTSTSSAPGRPVPKKRSASNVLMHATLTSAANLANLLPTGTVLAFQALIPSFSNNGKCQVCNKYLAGCLILICTVICFLSSFTDSFRSNSDGKIYYGIATLKGFFVFNYTDCEGENRNDMEQLRKLRINFIDYVHAIVSLVVFLVFAFGDSNVQDCFIPKGIISDNELLVMNLPLGVGFLSSFLFTIFPTKRRGIGYTYLQNS